MAAPNHCRCRSCHVPEFRCVGYEPPGAMAAKARIWRALLSISRPARAHGVLFSVTKFIWVSSKTFNVKPQVCSDRDNISKRPKQHIEKASKILFLGARNYYSLRGKETNTLQTSSLFSAFFKNVKELGKTFIFGLTKNTKTQKSNHDFSWYTVQKTHQESITRKRALGCGGHSSLR